MRSTHHDTVGVVCQLVFLLAVELIHLQQPASWTE